MKDPRNQKTAPPRRCSFAKTQAARMPPLLLMQKRSYDEFLQSGLDTAFHSVFPMHSANGATSLHFREHTMKPPEYGERECKQRGLTYHRKVYATIDMLVLEKRGGEQKYVKSENVYMGDIPMMTEHASFVVNGTERVVVSQMHRSPGVFFGHDSGRATGKRLYSAKVIPYNGRWLDFEFDKKDVLHFRIDRRAKKPATVLLKALGYGEDEILRTFFEFETFALAGPGKITYRLQREFLENVTLPFDLKNARGGVIVPANQRVKKAHLSKIEEGAPEYHNVDATFLHGRRLAKDVVGGDGEILARANVEITAELLDAFLKAGVKELQTLYFHELDRGPYISKTLEEEERLAQGRRMSCEDARVVIYQVLRPGEPPNREMVNEHMHGIFFDGNSYNLSEVGRMKFNLRVDPSRPAMEYRVMVGGRGGRGREIAAAMVAAGVFATAEEASAAMALAGSRDICIAENLSLEAARAREKEINERAEEKLVCEVLPQTTLSRADILAVVQKIVAIKNGKENTDDIDSLANRRVRCVGEFVENYFRQGLLRVERAIRDRLSRADIEGLMPKDLISAKAVSSSVAEFFNGNQLSQFLDQTNPLSEITHKRRVSAFGAGGLNRERVGFEVRDVHPTHYGRLCPIETPEGQNIGLINSVANYADINRYGFLETPYREVREGRVTETIVHLSAIKEQGKVIAQAAAGVDASGRLLGETVPARRDGEFIMSPPEKVDYVDIAPAQMASVAASLIPFLEHDDANRALMGSNMQRQAVPCLRPQRPFVGTGVEAHIAADSGMVAKARRGGEVLYADADLVAVDSPEEELARPDMYDLTMHTRTNQNTDVNQRPAAGIAREGDVVAAEDIVVDGACSDDGDLALGQNLLVAFMPWNGYNFEDSILISERVVAEDRFSSVHIIGETAHARSTQLGAEEITRDIPHQPESALEWLNEEGIVEVGVKVKPGDILVGKVTPKGEHQLSPEEKLLRAVFGEKASDVKDSSLRMPPGSEGVVIDVRVLNSTELMAKDPGKNEKPGDKSGKGAGGEEGRRALERALEHAVKRLRAEKKESQLKGEEGKQAATEEIRREVQRVLEDALGRAVKRASERAAEPLRESKYAANTFAGARFMELAEKSLRRSVVDLATPLRARAAEWAEKEKKMFCSLRAPVDTILKLARAKKDSESDRADAIKVLSGSSRGGKLADRIAQAAEWAEAQALGFKLSDTELSEAREILFSMSLKFAVREKAAAKRARQIAEGKKAGEPRKSAPAEIKRGAVLSRAALAALKNSDVLRLRLEDESAHRRLASVAADVEKLKSEQADEAKALLTKLRNPPDLPQGILKTVKVYVAIRRNLQVGDKMAGRHGNKGVVSKIVPVESMPYLPDGTPVDIVLNPLGVPSRMNVGQILETHLGLAAKGLGAQLEKMLRDETKKRADSLRSFAAKIYGDKVDAKAMSDEEIGAFARRLVGGVHFASPIFDGASEKEIGQMLELAGLPAEGRMTLYDGHSGEPFHKPVTVGYAYMMKLHHLVDEKMHARSTGPYSLVTQQPLGGKAQGGGQRLGEMEVWALEAYGAAYTLREMLTVKSDDVTWRSKMFEDITEGDFQLKSSVPESFNVLMREIRAMGMDIDLD